MRLAEGVKLDLFSLGIWSEIVILQLYNLYHYRIGVAGSRYGNGMVPEL